MNQSQYDQLGWVKQQMASGRPVVEYGCPDCGEPNFSLEPANGTIYATQVYCPHCQELHHREVTADGEVEAASQPWLAD